MHYPVLVRPANLSIPSEKPYITGGLDARGPNTPHVPGREREREFLPTGIQTELEALCPQRECAFASLLFYSMYALAFLANCTRSSLPFLRANKVRVVWMPRDLTVPHARGRERQRERFISDLPARGKTQFEPNRLLNSVCPLRTSYHFAARGTLPFQ